MHSIAEPAVNLSINGHLPREGRELGVNLSQTPETALIAEVKQRRAERWRRDNRAVIAADNADVAENGVFGDGLRSC